MNRKLFHRFLKPGGLYAPQSRQSSSENIRCADCVGIARATTGETSKLLSFAVFFMRRSAIGTGSGSIGRINAHKTNTVLLSFLFDPVEHLPVCPRRHSLTKRFASALLFATLHIVKGFNTNGINLMPRQLIDNSIDQVVPLFLRFCSSLATRLTAFDLIPDSFELFAVMISVGIREQLINANINGHNGFCCVSSRCAGWDMLHA
jgi:hypothetical protein